MTVASEQLSSADAPPLGREAQAARSPWVLLALLMAVAATSHFNRISMPIAGDERVMAQYGIKPTQMGWVYSSYLIAYTLCMIPGGWFIDRFGPKLALGAMGCGSALFVALTGLVGLRLADGSLVFLSLLVVRALMGAVTAPLHPSCARVVGTRVPAGARSLANGMVTGAALVGIAATPLVFGSLIGRFDWPSAFLIAACFTALVTLAWFVFTPEDPELRRGTRGSQDPGPDGGRPASPAGSLAGWPLLLRDRSLILLTVSYAAVGYFQYLFFYWMHFYFEDVLQLPDEKSRLYTAIPVLAMGAGMPLGGWACDLLEGFLGVRWGRRIVPMAGMAGGAAFLVLGILTKQPAWIVTWFAFALGAVGAAEGPFWSTSIERGGRWGGSAAALINTGGNAGGILAPIVTPWVGEHYGWPWAVALGSVVCLLGVVLWLGVEAGHAIDETRAA